MQLLVELKHLGELESLLPLLKGIGVKIVYQEVPMESKPLVPLSKHIGKLPDLNTKAFENYIQQTRDEWERPIY